MAVLSTGGLVAGEHVAALVWLARQLLDWTTIYYLGGFAYPLLESVRGHPRLKSIADSGGDELFNEVCSIC